jgi:hypothetical protein
MKRSLQLSFAASILLAVLAAAGSGGCGPLDDCAAVCDTGASCAPGFDAQGCADACHAAVSSFGAIAADVVAGCRACVTSTSCDAIAGGTCDSSCPASVPGLPHGGSSGLGECTETWPDTPGYKVTRTSNDVCSCYVGGVKTTFFDSTDFCTLSAAAQRSQANRGCGWDLPACSATWSDGASREVRCAWPGTEATSLTCECLTSGQPVSQFQSSDFCDLDAAAQLARAQANCG